MQIGGGQNNCLEVKTNFSQENQYKEKINYFFKYIIGGGSNDNMKKKLNPSVNLPDTLITTF